MTRERKLKIALILANLVFTTLLICALKETSLLVMSTIVALCLYPQIWLSWKLWCFYAQPLMQLTVYTQALKEGEHNLSFNLGNNSGLVFGLLREINALAFKQRYEEKSQDTVVLLASTLLSQWNQPVCLFDQDLNLIFSNNTAVKLIARPMLRGTPATAMGFRKNQKKLNHPVFNKEWQSQTLLYHFEHKTYWLFNAVYLGEAIYQASILSQKNLVRVLSHELRNSLTPMASMADTLLGLDTLPEQQTRLVLSRIQSRSERLLGFITEYARLSQLPEPKCEWFELTSLIEETRSLLPQEGTIMLEGESKIYGDPGMLEQVIINLIENAIEVVPGQAPHIRVLIYQNNQRQFLEISDKGPGFSNLDNLFTPFYSTKPEGSGIGLALSREIIRRHCGDMVAKNKQGAVLIASWPLEVELALRG